MAGNILVPVDFSPHTMISCQYALMLARLMRLDVVLFHSFYDQIYFSDGGFATGFESGIMLTDEIILDFYKQKEARLHEIADEMLLLAGEERPSTSVTCQIESGDPEVMILNAIARMEPRLIVMASSGIGKKRIFSGSVARKIMDSTAVPVFAVPGLEDIHEIRQVVYMTNFDPSDPLVISEIDSLLSPLKIHISCLHLALAKNETESIASMEALSRKELAIRPDTSISFQVITGSDPQESLDRYIEDNRSDLIAFIPHKKNIFKNFSRQNLTRDDLFLTRTPILAIPCRF